MEILPAEIYPIILSHADFGLWRAARYVSRKWNNIIEANQCAQIWNFIREGRLPNGVQHGYVNQNSFCYLSDYDIFRYGNKIARETYTGYKSIYHELLDTSGSISVAKQTKGNHIIYKLYFKIEHHGEFFCVNFNRHLNMKSITIKNREYIRVHNDPFLFVHEDILDD